MTDISIKNTFQLEVLAGVCNPNTWDGNTGGRNSSLSWGENLRSVWPTRDLVSKTTKIQFL